MLPSIRIRSKAPLARRLEGAVAVLDGNHAGNAEAAERLDRDLAVDRVVVGHQHPGVGVARQGRDRTGLGADSREGAAGGERGERRAPLGLGERPAQQGVGEAGGEHRGSARLAHRRQRHDAAGPGGRAAGPGEGGGLDEVVGALPRRGRGGLRHEAGRPQARREGGAGGASRHRDDDRRGDVRRPRHRLGRGQDLERDLGPEGRAAADLALDPIRPPIAATRRSAIERPSPVPPKRRVVEPSACEKAERRSSAGSRPGCRSRYR